MAIIEAQPHNIVSRNGLIDKHKTTSLERNPEAVADVFTLHETYSHLATLGSRKVNAYARNGLEDEVSIRMPDGEHKGFFKTYSLPLLPFLETRHLSIYTKIHQPIAEWIHTHPQDGFEDAIRALATNDNDPALARYAQEAQQILSSWTETSLEQPARLKSSMSFVMAQSLETDAALTQVFKEDEQTKQSTGVDKIAQTAAQLNFAFGIASPFYSIEAVVDNKRNDFPYDPVKLAEHAVIEHGNHIQRSNLEVLLDSAAHSMRRIFDTTDSQTMDWKTIAGAVNTALTQSENIAQARILSEVAWKTGRSCDEVMFALWKKNQASRHSTAPSARVPEQNAVAQFENSLHSPPPDSKEETILQDAGKLNATMRFLGDTPSHKDQSNFTDGSQLVYGSVCDTTNTLGQLVFENPDIWSDTFYPTLAEVIQPQMAKIPPYSSARGRILLDLLINTPGALKPQYQETILAAVSDTNRTADYIDRLTHIRKTSQIRRVGSGIRPADLIGGKAKGLEHAQEFLASPSKNSTDTQPFVEIKVPDGIEVTTERVEEMILRANPDLYQSICLLHQTSDPMQREALRAQIHHEILQLNLDPDDIALLFENLNTLPDNLIVRSSASDEAMDEDAKAQAHAGFYESHKTTKDTLVTDMLKVMASYYNEGSVMFRNSKGLGHMPRMALLIQELVDHDMGGNFLINYNADPTLQEVFINAASEAAHITTESESPPDGTGVNSDSVHTRNFASATKNGEHLYVTKDGIIKIPPRLLMQIEFLQTRLSDLHRRSGIIEFAWKKGSDTDPDKLMVLQEQIYPRESGEKKTKPFPEDKPHEFHFGPATDIAQLAELIGQSNGPLRIVIEGNPDRYHMSTHYRALCLQFGDRIQDIQFKSNEPPPPRTSHIGIFTLSLYPWLEWDSIWSTNSD